MTAADAAVINLGDRLTIAGVAERRREMSAALDSGGPVVLQGGEIRQIDGAGLQLLAALIKEAAATGVAIRWDGISDALQQGARQLGLNEVLIRGFESDV